MKRLALAGALLALLVRIPLALQHADTPLQGDMITYNGLAESILAGDGFAFRGHPDAVKSPGYPYFVAGMYRVFGQSRLPILLFQDVVSALTCFTIVLLGFRVTRSRGVAFLAGLAYALYYPMANFTNLLLTDSLFVAVALAFYVALDWAVRSRRTVTFVPAGVLLALSLYLRPTLALFLLVACLVAVWWEGRLWRPVLRFAVVGVVAYALLLPWSLRNQQVSGVLTPLPAQKMVLYQFWNWRDMRTVDPGGYIPPDIQKALEVRNWYEVSDSLFHVGLAEVRGHPFEYAVSVGAKTVRQWTNLLWPQPPSTMTLLFAGVNLLLLILAAAALRGDGIDRLFRGYAVASFLYITAMGAFMSSAEPRFAFWVYPFLFVLAASTVVRLSPWGRRRPDRAPA